MTDPRRLLDDPSSASPELRSLLESARRDDDPTDDRLAALTTRLGPLLAPLAPPPPPQTPTPTPSAAPLPVAAGKAMLAAKIGGALVAAGLVAGGAWIAFDRSGAPPPAPPPARMIAPDASLPEPALEVAPDAMPPSLAVPEPRAPRDVDSDAEATLVQAAQSALVRRAPADALALTRQHATRFAAGPHAEERDRIAIEALVQLGHVDDARARAQKFFARYPRSIYRARIEALLP